MTRFAHAPKVCSACSGTDHLRPGSPWHGPHIICNPCFMVWYDPERDIDQTDPKQVGAESLRLKALGKFPWAGQYAPTPVRAPEER